MDPITSQKKHDDPTKLDMKMDIKEIIIYKYFYLKIFIILFTALCIPYL